jgi:hypothetical protein
MLIILYSDLNNKLKNDGSMILKSILLRCCCLQSCIQNKLFAQVFFPRGRVNKIALN